MMEARERAEQLVEEALSLIREISEEGWEAVEEAEKQAYANLARLQAVQEERESLRKRSDAIVRELSAAPGKLAQATLDQDFILEDQIRESYTRLKNERETIERERRELAEEARELLGPNASRPGHVPHPLEAEIYQRRKIPAALSDAMGPFFALARLASVIQSELHGFQAASATHRARSESLNDTRLAETQRARGQAAASQRRLETRLQRNTEVEV